MLFRGSTKKRMGQTEAKAVKSEFAAKFNLYGPLVKALEKKGYKNPTPIQRKVIPELLQRNDVVAMARTGSGKTGAFVIPLIHHLKTHSAKVLAFLPFCIRKLFFPICLEL